MMIELAATAEFAEEVHARAEQDGSNRDTAERPGDGAEGKLDCQNVGNHCNVISHYFFTSFQSGLSKPRARL